MNAREWQPGDVALVLNEHKVWNVAICTLRSGRHGYWWRYGVADSWSPIVADARPLVVIDPEDRAGVERLRDLFPVAWNLVQHDDPDLGQESVDEIQAALRRFIAPSPPRPDEPLGQFAVVEAEDSEEWLRRPEELSDSRPWNLIGTDCWAEWDDIRAVRVLSAGVPS